MSSSAVFLARSARSRWLTLSQRDFSQVRSTSPSFAQSFHRTSLSPCSPAQRRLAVHCVKMAESAHKTIAFSRLFAILRRTMQTSTPTTLCPFTESPNHDDSTPNLKSEFLNLKYPAASLPRSLQSLTETLAEALRLPEAHVATTGLALLSAALGSSSVLSHGFALTRANLFCLLLSPDSPAAATAFRTLAAPLFEAHENFGREMETETFPAQRIDLANLRRQRRQLLSDETPRPSPPAHRPRSRNPFDRILPPARLPRLRHPRPPRQTPLAPPRPAPRPRPPKPRRPPRCRRRLLRRPRLRQRCRRSRPPRRPPRHPHPLRARRQRHPPPPITLPHPLVVPPPHRLAIPRHQPPHRQFPAPPPFPHRKLRRLFRHDVSVRRIALKQRKSPIS